MNKINEQVINNMKKHKKLKIDIKLLILDVDGVLTNGKLYISDNGVEAKAFHVHDGIGIKLLLNNNIEVAVISGKKSKATTIRLKELGVKYIYQGVTDKAVQFDKIKSKLNIKNENIACVGDDIIDIPMMLKAGFSVAVANAHKDIFYAADYITKLKGGCGAVREVCDIILK